MRAGWREGPLRALVDFALTSMCVTSVVRGLSQATVSHLSVGEAMHAYDAFGERAWLQCFAEVGEDGEDAAMCRRRWR